MTPHHIRQGGILAAGEGTRLATRGPKPLVVVGGAPLILHALERLRRVGIQRVAVVVREERRDLADLLRDRCPELDLEIECRSTSSSAASLRVVLARLAPERAIVTTVDAVLHRSAFEDFARRAQALPEDALGLGVTAWVDDEKPLWASWTQDGRVVALGGSHGQGVTAGLYVVPAGFADADLGVPPQEPLRRWLAAWVEAGRPAFALPLPTVIDVDRPADVDAAEAFLRGDGTLVP